MQGDQKFWLKTVGSLLFISVSGMIFLGILPENNVTNILAVGTLGSLLLGVRVAMSHRVELSSEIEKSLEFVPVVSRLIKFANAPLSDKFRWNIVELLVALGLVAVSIFTILAIYETS